MPLWPFKAVEKRTSLEVRIVPKGDVAHPDPNVVREWRATPARRRRRRPFGGSTAGQADLRPGDEQMHTDTIRRHAYGKRKR
jgi:hypothetical protein